MDKARIGHVPGHMQVESCECLKRLHSVKGRKATNLVHTKHRFNLVVRLIAIKYYERLLCYLSSYINLLMSDLWLDLDLWSRPQFQGWCIAFIPYASHLMPAGRNRNRYYYLLSTSFECWFSELLTGLGIALTIWLYLLKFERSKT